MYTVKNLNCNFLYKWFLILASVKCKIDLHSHNEGKGKCQENWVLM